MKTFWNYKNEYKHLRKSILRSVDRVLKSGNIFFGNELSKFENNLQYAKKKGKWQSNLFTSINYHDKEIDEDKNGFLDMPHMKSFNVLNRWVREDERHRFSFIGRFFIF